MGLRKLWPDLQISVKILFWGDFASRCLKVFYQVLVSNFGTLVSQCLKFTILHPQILYSNVKS